MLRLFQFWNVLLLVLVATRVDAATITLAWDANTEPDLAGYVVLYGTSPGNHSVSVDVGNTTTWTLNSAVEGQTYYFVVQAYNTNGVRSASSNQVFHTVSPTTGPSPTMSLNRTALYYGTVQNGAVITQSQTVSVYFANGTAAWTAASSAPWLEIVAGAGNGPGTFTARVRPGAYSAGVTRNATITVSAPGSTNTQVSLPVTFRSYAAGANPTGVIDTPGNNVVNVTGAIAFTGWAIDDVEVRKVTIWRDPVGAEGANQVYVGKALFVDGTRPDLDALYNQPFDYRAGWGLAVLTNMLPNQGNGTYRLYAYAEDADGHNVLIGSRTITCNNANATRPFGTIDTPAPGEVVSGTNVLNFGWVLAPQPNAIPGDGSTLMVYIDGVPVGRPVYGYNRADISTLFPGLANSNSAIGLFQFDSTQLSNGVHTISWGVADNAGNGHGLGSRYFTVMNGTASGGVTSSLTVAPEASVQSLTTGVADTREAVAGGSDLGRTVDAVADVPESTLPSYVRTGVEPGAALHVVEPDDFGRRRVTTTELSRVEITLGAPVTGDTGGYEGYLLTGDTLSPLPAGAFLDRRTGVLFWELGPGYVGNYDLLFVRSAGGARERILISVTVESLDSAASRDRGRQ